MTPTVPLHHRRNVLAAALLSVIALVAGLASPAGAEPTDPPDERSKLDTMRSNLESAAIAYLDTDAALSASVKKQADLNKQLVLAKLDMARAKVSVAKYAGTAYKTGRVGTLEMILNATSPDQFLGRAVAINKMTQRDQARLAELVDARRRAEEATLGLQAVIAFQTKLKKELAQRRHAAELALSKMGAYAVNGWMDPSSPAAVPAPRNPDGSWPRERCVINDPTTSGCITPRTLHALKQAKEAGFTRYVSCFRPGNRYEHPKGRACDFSAERDGFHNSNASGGDKLYGDKLASFYVKNARALGVMYVVWYCKVWLVGSGWKRYSSTGSNCGDAPAGDHTNHVHVSIY